MLPWDCQADPDELRRRGAGSGSPAPRSIPRSSPARWPTTRSLILEDRDGDGKADKTTVFADGLLIPTGHRAGRRRGLRRQQHRAAPPRRTPTATARPTAAGSSSRGSAPRTPTTSSTPCGGATTGMLYFNQSIYIHSHIETPHGVRRLGGGGIWQFRPETMELDVFIRGLVQPLGPPLRPLGPVVRDRRRRGRGDQLLPPRRLLLHGRRTPSASCTGLNPGSPKYCGLEVVSGRHLPEDWQGNLLTNDFRGNRVCRFVLTDDGAGFAVARAARADQDPARRLPADRRQDGPRRRDLHRRLVQPDHPARRGRLPRPPPRPHPRPDLAGHRQGPPARRAAEARRRTDRGAARRPQGPRGLDPPAAPSACSRSGARPRSSPRWPPGSRGSTRATPRPSTTGSKRSGPTSRSTWSSPTCSPSCSDSPDPRVRAAAVRVVRALARTGSPTRSALLAARVADEHPAGPARSRPGPGRTSPSSRSAELALRALDRPVDRFLDYALWLTARELAAVLAARRSRRAGSTSAATRAAWSSRSRRSARPTVVKPLLAPARERARSRRPGRGASRP